MLPNSGVTLLVSIRSWLGPPYSSMCITEIVGPQGFHEAWQPVIAIVTVMASHSHGHGCGHGRARPAMAGRPWPCPAVPSWTYGLGWPAEAWVGQPRPAWTVSRLATASLRAHRGRVNLVCEELISSMSESEAKRRKLI